MFIESLDVYSWNIGHDKIIEKCNNLVNNIQSLPDILVIGFQETSAMSFSTIQKQLSNTFKYTHKLLAKEETCLMSTTLNNSFVIGTLIFVNVNKYDLVNKVSVVKDCKSLTKGFLNITLKVHNEYVNIINAHLPFKNDLSNFANLFLKFFDTINENETTIILGDLNSRSLILPDCYKKDVQFTCTEQDNCKVSSLVQRLQQLTLYDSIDVSPSVKSLNIENKQICGIHGSHLINDGTSFDRFVKLMIKKDFLKLFLKRENTINNAEKEFEYITKNDQTITSLLLKLKHQLSSYCESPIHFYPTYKRKPSDGMFSLSKKNVGRLPGYADRIIFKNPKNIIKAIKYTSLPVIGNDHLPIVKKFGFKY